MSIMCFVTVKIQFDSTSTYECSSYLLSARPLCSIVHLGPPFRNSGSAPDLFTKYIVQEYMHFDVFQVGY